MTEAGKGAGRRSPNRGHAKRQNWPYVNPEIKISFWVAKYPPCRKTLRKGSGKMTKDLRKEYVENRSQYDAALPKECGNCGSTDDLHIHHIVPLSCGGNNRITNLARLCTDCHSKAHGGYALTERAAESQRKNIAKGGIKNGSMPLGYSVENGKYVINEDTAEIVRLIFRLRYKGEYSSINIAEILNYLAIPTTRGAKVWKHPSVARILKNPQYFGQAVFDGKYYGDVYPVLLTPDIIETKQRFDKKYEGKRVPPRSFVLYREQSEAM